MKKLKTILLQLLPFLILFIISKTILKDLYLFEWTARHLYLYIWIVVVLLTYFDKTLYSTVLSVLNVIGIFIGQFLGDWIRTNNMLKITSGMDAETRYQLHKHYGFWIWLAIILAGMLLTVIIKKINCHDK